MSALLHIEDLHFAHGDRAVLHGLSLNMEAGEILVIVGASGCGKTTLLRLIAGLEKPASGSVALQGVALSTPKLFVEPERRPIGFVFQGLALFPHLTVQENIAFGLAHLPRAERAQAVADELKAVDLADMGQRYPHQLSGGQQQRVAIARSLVRRPALILMDEPFSDLDHSTRKSVRTEVLRILRTSGTAAIIVTHDREDAYHVADRIMEMEAGHVVRSGSATEFRARWAQDPFNA